MQAFRHRRARMAFRTGPLHSAQPGMRRWFCVLFAFALAGCSGKLDHTDDAGSAQRIPRRRPRLGPPRAGRRVARPPHGVRRGLVQRPARVALSLWRRGQPPPEALRRCGHVIGVHSFERPISFAWRPAIPEQLPPLEGRRRSAHRRRAHAARRHLGSALARAGARVNRSGRAAAVSCVSRLVASSRASGDDAARG